MKENGCVYTLDSNLLMLIVGYKMSGANALANPISKSDKHCFCWSCQHHQCHSVAIAVREPWVPVRSYACTWTVRLVHSVPGLVAMAVLQTCKFMATSCLIFDFYSIGIYGKLITRHIMNQGQLGDYVTR